MHRRGNHIGSRKDANVPKTVGEKSVGRGREAPRDGYCDLLEARMQSFELAGEH